MFAKILYPTDFSDVSKKALGFIQQLKDAGAKEVVVLHVIDEREIQQIAPVAGFNTELVEMRRKEGAQQQMKAIEDTLKSSGLSVKTLIKKGVPFRDILRTEAEEGVSVIVLGSHGKSAVTEMLLGSVSEKVIRKSNKPVLVVRR